METSHFPTLEQLRKKKRIPLSIRWEGIVRVDPEGTYHREQHNLTLHFHVASIGTGTGIYSFPHPSCRTTVFVKTTPDWEKVE